MGLRCKRSFLLPTAAALVATAWSAPAAARTATFEADPGSLGVIPDGPETCGSNNSTRDVAFAVSGLSGTIVDVRVTFTLANAGAGRGPGHTHVGDLSVRLIAPDNGAGHSLFERTGGTSCLQVDSSNAAGPYTFADDANSPPFGGWWEAAAGTGPDDAIPSGTYRTTGCCVTQSAGKPTLMTAAFFPLADPNGTWTLRFEDQFAEDVGAVTTASLTITAVDWRPPAPPALSTTDPVSGSDHNLPRVTGQAEADSRVGLFLTADCTGAPAATGTAAELASPGIPVEVADNTHNEIRAVATDAAGNASPCSSQISYDEVTPSQGGTPAPDATEPEPAPAEPTQPEATQPPAVDASAPETAISSAPRRSSRRAVKFTFESNEADALFQCSLDRRKFKACESPRRFRDLEAGRHRFAVRAIDAAGNADPSPATQRFRVSSP
ncbi:MAG TPA: hypothetical protein VFY99_03460 [Solirubrobacterales bacterium]